MDNNFFKPAGNLDDSKDTLLYSKKNLGEGVGFKPAGDLDSDGLYPKKEVQEASFFKKPEEMVSYFKPAGDLDYSKSDSLDSNKVLGEGVGFKPAGDLLYDNPINKEYSYNDVNDYLLSVVSGKKYDSVCELGVLMGGGRTIVTLEGLKQMVEQGYNIVSANVINTDMIEIEYQKYIYNEEMMERRRRF